MALTFDFANLVIESSASITDLPAFHAACRDAEDSSTGMLYPATHRWKDLDLGGGAHFYQADLIGGWQLKFPAPGNYEISGNLQGTIVPVAGVYVERRTSAAYITTAVGAEGPTAESIAAALLAALGAATIPVDVQKMNGAEVIGDGTTGNAWRGVGVSP